MGNTNREYRTITAEFRASEDASQPRIEGRAVVYDQTIDLGFFRERVAKGAFTRAISEQQDIRFLVNHSPDQLLGRTKSGTLTISQDDRGVNFSCLMPDTQLGKDTYTLIKRGDLSQCSFGFVVTQESVSYDDDGTALRTIEDLNCFDLSAVCYAAYPTTNVQARSAEEIAEGFKKPEPPPVPDTKAADAAALSAQKAAEADAERIRKVKSSGQKLRF